MVRPALFGLAAAFLIGCTDEGLSFRETPLPTSVSVSPVDFQGEVPCGPVGESEAGKLGSFQATLVDVTEGLPQKTFTLPSSNVVPCEKAAVFMFVVPGHRYEAHITAYERRDLKVRTPGYPEVVAADEPNDGSGATVLPRWKSTCYGTAEALEAATAGDAAGGAGGAGGAGAAGALGDGGLGGSGTTTPRGLLALPNAQLPLRGCTPLAP